MSPYRHVVVGTDGSETAAEAVRHAAELAAACGARLTVVSAFVHDAETEAKAQADVPADMRWRVTDAATAEAKANDARKAAQQAGCKEVSVEVVAGDPADVVIEAATFRNADLIVVGSKGMTSASRFVLGSVPNKISHRAPCDVIIVRTAP